MITAADVCAVSGYTRNQLRGVLNELPIYAEQETSARVAREYSRADLSVLSVVYVLDVQFNVRRAAIALIADQLRQTLSGPKPINRAARLLVTFDPLSVRYLTEKETIQTGILVALGLIFARVDAYIAGNPLDNVNRELNFGPTPIPDKRKVAKG
jgi:hypothetical protein